MGQISDLLLVEVSLIDRSNYNSDNDLGRKKAIRKWTPYSFENAEYSREEGIPGVFVGGDELVLIREPVSQQPDFKNLNFSGLHVKVGPDGTINQGNPFGPIECIDAKKNKYYFKQGYHYLDNGRDGLNFRMVVLHVLLPEFCYCDRFEFVNTTKTEAIIRTDDTIQTINWIHKVEQGQELSQEVTFIYDENQFRSMVRGIERVPRRPESRGR